jgi:hypothetical protein
MEWGQRKRTLKRALKREPNRRAWVAGRTAKRIDQVGKHIFSGIPVRTYPDGAPLDASKWAPESEDEDEEDAKRESAAAKECCEEKGARKQKKQSTRKRCTPRSWLRL